MLKLLGYLKKKEWLFIGVCLGFIVAQVWLDLKLPDYMASITRLVQTQGSEMRDILKNGGYMLLCALGSMASAMIVGYFAARIGAGLSMRLRRAVFKKTLSFSMEEISGFSTASLITRSTNDITQVQMVIAMGMQAMIKAPILAVWAVLKISAKNWEWTTATGVAVAVLIALLSVAVTLAIPRFKRIQNLTDNLNRVTRENLTGIRVVRAYNAEKYEERKFEAANTELTDTNLFVNRVMAVMMPGMSLIMSGMSLSIYWIGAYMIDAAALAAKINLFADMVVFSSYSMQVIMAFMMLTIIFIMLPRASVSARRILEVLGTRPRVRDGVRTQGEDGCAGRVEFRHVGFQYPDSGEKVLHDISFTAKKGEMVAFIGATGSGKSTLINLIPRFYDATEGTVLVGGADVREYSQKALRDRIGYVSQKAVLFSGTVASNVAYGDNGGETPDEAAVTRAVALAQGADFVEAMEGGYQGAVARGGTNVSGGQKQRLSIARAVARKPEILIFDDAFSALDYKTDRALRSALRRENRGVTTLIVAQRIGTIRDADRIIVLENGEIAGSGTHGELMASCGAYREIAYSQLSKEELENA